MHEMQRIFCPNCGLELSPNANFCRSCGAKSNIAQVARQQEKLARQQEKLARRQEELETALLGEGPEAIDALLHLLFDAPRPHAGHGPQLSEYAQHISNMGRIKARLKELIKSSMIDEETLMWVSKIADPTQDEDKLKDSDEWRALIDAVSPITSNILWLIAKRPDYSCEQIYTYTVEHDYSWSYPEDRESTKTYFYRFRWQRANADIELARRGNPPYDSEAYLTGTSTKQAGTSVFDGLVELLLNPDEDAAKGAAVALGELGDKRAVEPLIKALTTDKRIKVRREAVIALGELGDKRAVEPLIKASKNDRFSVSERAKIALRKIDKN